MITSFVATPFRIARGGFDFWAFLLSKYGEESPMNLNFQELLQQFESRDGEKIQHVLIGTPEGIENVQRALYRLRYANMGLWSPIIPMPGTSASMSILTRYYQNIDS